eukprot:358126-Chlamydomonas_euryale.AAC.7
MGWPTHQRGSDRNQAAGRAKQRRRQVLKHGLVVAGSHRKGAETQPSRASGHPVRPFKCGHRSAPHVAAGSYVLPQTGRRSPGKPAELGKRSTKHEL